MSTGWRVAWVSPLGLFLPAGYAQWRPHSMANAEKSPARHTRKPAPSARGDHLDGLAVDELDMDGHDVGLAQQVLLGGIVDTRLLAFFRREIRAPGDHFHAERLGD